MTKNKPKQHSCRMLVVDSSKCYASLVKEQIEQHVTNCDIDIAINIWELRRKLATKNYNLIIADISVSLDEEEMLSEMKTSQVPVYYWQPGNQAAQSAMNEKPSSIEGIKERIDSLVNVN